MMPPRGPIRIYRIPLLKNRFRHVNSTYIVSSVITYRSVSTASTKYLQIVSIHSNLYVTGILFTKNIGSILISDCLECIL